MATTPTDAPSKRTPLHDVHVAMGAKMVPFAGYDMPVQYPLGVLKEHLWTREQAGLFDVSHMGQCVLVAADHRHETAAAALELLCPADFRSLKPGQQRYSQLLTETGGIVDDLMVTRPFDPADEGSLFAVVNASRKTEDYSIIKEHFRHLTGMTLTERHRALIALQGPTAAAVMQALAPETAALAFMTARKISVAGFPCEVSRSGYTGEDGYEISVPESDAVALWQALANDPRVQPIGLGARDSLRLEAGLCLYGHDINTATSPVEAGLTWSIQKRRRLEGGFPGADRVQRELKDGPARVRVGIKPEGRAPAREGTDVLAMDGASIGEVTSGGFGPSVNGPIAMGYVLREHTPPGTKVQLVIRGKTHPAEIVTLPFTPHRYFKPKS
jgi:aminomethyltransferase